MRTVYKILLSTLFMLICLAPLLISSKLGIVDPFLHGHIASTILWLDKNHIDLSSTYFKYVPGFGYLVIILSKICDISPQTIEYLPITGMLFIFVIYVLVKKLTSSFLIAWMITGVLIFRWISPFLYSIWPHGFGYLLYLLFISTYFNLDKKNKLKTLAVLLIVFLGVHLFSYNAELWIISFMLFANLILVISQKIGKTKEVKTTFLLLLAFIILFVTFNRVIYEAWFPKFQVVYSEIGITFKYYFSLLFRLTPPEQYLYVPPPSPLLLFFSNILFFTLIILPLIILNIINLLKLKSFKILISNLSFKSVVILSLFLVWLADIASYIPIGAVTVAFTRYFTLIGPLLAIICLKSILNQINIKIIKNRVNRILETYALVMLVSSVLIFSLTLHHGYYITSPSKYTELDPSAFWFFNHTENVDYIFSDHNTQGRYSIVGAELGIVFKPENLYTVLSYKHLVDPSYISTKHTFFYHKFVVLNLELANKKTTAGGWRDLEPLSKYLKNVNSNINLNKVYDDGIVNIYLGI